MSDWQQKGVPIRCTAKGIDHSGYYFVISDLTTMEAISCVREVYPAALSAFRQADIRTFYEDVQDHVLESEELIVLRNGTNEISAFETWSLVPSAYGYILHLGGICISEGQQGKRLGGSMIAKAVEICLKRENVEYVVLRTQNPAMQQCLSKCGLAGDMYSVGDTDIPHDIQRVAKTIADLTGDKQLNPETLISPRVYGSSIYGDSYNHDTESANTVMQELNPQRGDATYCILRH